VTEPQQQRLPAIGLTLALATLALIAALSVRSTGRVVEASDALEHTHRVLGAAQRVLGDLQEAAARQRAFLLTGQAMHLGPFAEAVAATREEVDRLAALTRDDASQRRRLEALRPVTERRIASLEHAIGLRRLAPAPVPLPEPAVITAGEALVGEAQAILGGVQQEERRLLTLRQGESRRSIRFATAAVGLGSAASAALLLGAFAALRREIAQRLRAEEEARGHADEVEDLYNLAPCGYQSLDREGRFLRINDTELAWLGYAREEVVGRLRFQDFLTAESAARFARYLLAFVGGAEVGVHDFELVRRDGSVLTVSVSASAIRDESGRFVASRSTVFDVTDRRKVEQARDRIFTLSQDLLCVAGADGYFQRVNPAWERVLGYSAEEITGQPFLEFVHPDDRDATLEAFAQQIEEGASITSFENRYRAKDGSYRVLLWNSTPVKSEGMVYASARDITERKQIEDALRASKLAAEAANRELEAFSYSVSHDLRAPLRAIDGFSHSLLEDYERVLDAEGKRYLGRICVATQRMSDLIEDLLELSRISRGQIQRGRVDLSALAEQVVASLRRAEPERKVETRIPRGLNAWGDARLLRIGLENLLGNAWKYTRKRERARIELGAAVVDGQPAWWVRDNGAGFDMAYASRLFGAFQRLHRSDEFEGTGIGLATTERIVRLHGGRIWAEAEVDKGATFYFTLGPEGE
jgi:PAS domain S-box-containing protein